MHNIYSEQLSYDELLNPKGISMNIFSPRHIPIHPTVYNSEFAYSSEFVNKILNSIDDSISEDLDAIDKTLGKKIHVEKLDLQSFAYMANPKRKSLDVQYGSTNIAVEPGSFTEIFLTRYDAWPRMNIARAKTFSIASNELKIPAWYIHNIEDQGVSVYLFYRNFAILFNNIGIAEIASGRTAL